ncbi:MAG: NAD-dependent epimerase/dehydratase family protein, partial [Chitinophagales bacterium]
MNSSTKKTALVIGATGLIGRQCVVALLQNEQYSQVTTLVRHLSGATHPKLDERIIDFEHLEEYVDAMKVDDVFCCMGTTIKKARSKEKFRKVDYEYPLRVAQIALQQGAK